MFTNLQLQTINSIFYTTRTIGTIGLLDYLNHRDYWKFCNDEIRVELDNEILKYGTKQL